MRWSKLIAEDVNTDGFWEDVEGLFGEQARGEANASIVKGWVREWAARITRIFG